MKTKIYNFFNIENTKTFLLIFFILVIFNELIKNNFLDFYYISHNIIFWYGFLLSIFISIRIIIFLIFNFNINKIFSLNILLIIFQIFVPLIFIIKFFSTSNLSFIFISYFLVFFLILLIFHLLKDMKTKSYSIKKSFIEYKFDFIDLGAFYFILSFLIPVVFALILEDFFKNNIFLEIIITLLILPIFMFFGYFFFKYLVYLKKLKKSEFPINNEFTYIKLLTFYKFKKISILDQVYIFLSYIIPSINIKYIEFLRNYKQEGNLFNYLINNFSTELLFKNYEASLKEIINKFPEIKLDFKKLYAEISNKNLKKYHKYMTNKENILYCIGINKQFDLNNIFYDYLRSIELKNVSLNNFEKQVLNFINVEILLNKKQSTILFQEKFIEYIDSEIDNSLKSISYKLINWINRSIFVILTLIGGIIGWIHNTLDKNGIDIFGYLLRIIGSNKYEEEINKIFFELSKNDFIKQNFITDNTNNLLIGIGNIFGFLIIILCILLSLWLLALGIRLYMTLLINKLNYIKKYIKFEIQKTH